MNLSGSHSIPVPADRAWHLLLDPAILAKCIPGCEGLELIGENEYRMRMKMALASVSGLFDGKVRIADQKPPTSYKLIVEGSGKIGFMKGEGVLTLKENGSETTVDFNGEVQVGGTIAAVGQRLIDTTARLLIKRFFSQLAKEVENGDSNALHSRS